MNIEIKIVKEENLIYMAHDGSSGVKYKFKDNEDILNLIKEYVEDALLDE